MAATISSDVRSVSAAAAKSIAAASATSGTSRTTSIRSTTVNRVVLSIVQAGGMIFQVGAKVAEVVSGRMPPTDAKAAEKNRAMIGATTVVEIGKVARPEKERGGKLSRPNRHLDGGPKPLRLKDSIVMSIEERNGVTRNAEKDVARMSDEEVATEMIVGTNAMVASAERIVVTGAAIGTIAARPRSATEEVTVSAGTIAAGAMKGAAIDTTSKPIVKRRSSAVCFTLQTPKRI